MSLTWIEAARRGQGTVEIVERGLYEVDGVTVDIEAAVARAVEGTVEHPPDVAIAAPRARRGATRITVANETTLAAARRLVEAGRAPVALNFASDVSPGGRFLQGALAQEEFLARSSALFATIRGRAFYVHHRSRADPLASDYAIYSPEVPVIRDDDGDALLPTPYPLGFITCAAVRRDDVRGPDRARVDEVMRGRIERVLDVADLHGHDTLVLGAWGCGAFGNRPEAIAEAFAGALRGPFDGVFKVVHFAVLDTTRSQKTFEAFRRM